MSESYLAGMSSEKENMILRLPEKDLGQFLTNLKSDYLKKKNYLDILKVNNKVI